MSRFGEFIDSLKEAFGYLDQAVSCLSADNFGSEGARYFEVHTCLADADSSLDEARQDLSDAVGIVANAEQLSGVVECLGALMSRIWSYAEDCLDEEPYDRMYARDHIQNIRALQREIDQIIHDAR